MFVVIEKIWGYVIAVNTLYWEKINGLNVLHDFWIKVEFSLEMGKKMSLESDLEDISKMRNL